MRAVFLSFLSISLQIFVPDASYDGSVDQYFFGDDISVEETRNLRDLADQIISKVRASDPVGMAEVFVGSPEPGEFSSETRWEAVEEIVISQKIFDADQNGSVANLIGMSSVQILFQEIDMDTDPGTRHFEIYFIPRSVQDLELDSEVAATKWIFSHKWLRDYHAILVGLTEEDEAYLPQGYFYFETDGPGLRGVYSSTRDGELESE